MRKTFRQRWRCRQKRTKHSFSGINRAVNGPHVHFEIYKNGRVVDPASYINRTDR